MFIVTLLNNFGLSVQCKLEFLSFDQDLLLFPQFIKIIFYFIQIDPPPSFSIVCAHISIIKSFEIGIQMTEMCAIELLKNSFSKKKRL